MVVERLAFVEVILREGSSVTATHIAGAHVLQPAEAGGVLGKIEDVSSTHDVDLHCHVARDSEIVDCGQVEDLARLLLYAGNVLQTEARRRDVPHRQFNSTAKARTRGLNMSKPAARLPHELRLDQANGLRLRRILKDPGQERGA